MSGKTRRTGLFAAAGIAAVFLTPVTLAGTIDFEPVVGTIQGSNTVVFEFDVVGTGTGVYRAILTDFENPAPFQLLGLGIVDESTGIILMEEIGTGTLQLDFTVDPGRYLALVGGLADADVNIGTFGLEISNVPIPAAGYLLGTALLAPGLLMRRRKRNTLAAPV